MTLTETQRQIVAGVAAAGAYLLAYFSLSLAAWFAIGVAIACYAATLLLVRRAPPPTETMLADGVSAHDLETALAAMRDAAERLRRLEKRAPARDVGVFARLGELLDRIAVHHRRDPGDLRHTRRFLRHDLPRIVETAESYVDLAARSGQAAQDRLAHLSGAIRGFAPALERIDQACLENDFMALEVEAEVLSEQLKHR